jgi:hypothetical protein
MKASKAQLASRIKTKILNNLLEKLNDKLLSSVMDDNMIEMVGADWYNPKHTAKPQQIEIKTSKGDFIVTLNVEPTINL